ncbi:unnamed protein product [Discosporangium mesarthrocarpum]
MLTCLQGCEEGVQTGLNLSRSTVRTFKHNDMEDLERLLEVCDLHFT